MRRTGKVGSDSRDRHACLQRRAVRPGKRRKAILLFPCLHLTDQQGVFAHCILLVRSLLWTRSKRPGSAHAKPQVVVDRAAGVRKRVCNRKLVLAKVEPGRCRNVARVRVLRSIIEIVLEDDLRSSSAPLPFHAFERPHGVAIPQRGVVLDDGVASVEQLNSIPDRTGATEVT